MPVIVDEVVISVDVSNEASGGASRPPSGEGSAGGAGGAGGASPNDRQALVAECVERVLEVLARREEP